MHTHVQREEASASYNFGWFRPTAWPPLFPVGDQTGGHWQGCPSPKLITVYQCQHTYHSPQAGPVFCQGVCLIGYLSVIDHDEECHDADRFDRLLRASEESLPRRAIGPEDKAFNNYSQTTAKTFRFKPMSHCSPFCTCRFFLCRR